MKKYNSTTLSICGRFLTAVGLLLMTMVTVRADYQSTVLGDTPLLYYALDSSVTNGTATDLSGNGNTGGAYNLTAASGPSPYITNAASFDGVDASIDVSNSPALLNFNGPITLEAWVQPTNIINTSGNELGNIIAKGYNGSYEIVLRDNDFNYYGNSGNAGVSGGTQTTDWTHLVLSSDGTNCSLYVNGVMVNRTADTSGSASFTSDWAIGTGSPDGQYNTNIRYYHGKMSQVAIYNHGLTADQVLTHYYIGQINAYPSNSAPIIITQPKPQATYITGSATFSVSAVSAFATTNQWLKNGIPISGKTNATLTLNNVQVSDATNYSVIVGNINGTTTSSVVALSLFTPNNLKWSGANSATWDNTTSTNWINQSNSSQTVFTPGDFVLFDDTVGVPTSVTGSGSLIPGMITVNSSTNNFTIGSGTVTGSGGLVKQGSSTLTIYDSGSMTGPVTISGGSIIAGNNTFSSVSSISITNNATLNLAGGTFNGNKPITVSGSGLNGQGAINNNYNDYPGQSVNITLAGDTVFGSIARWDLASGSQISGAHNLTLDWSGNTGTNGGDGNTYCEWSGVTIGANVLGITLTNHSKLGSHNNTTALQNPNMVTTVQTNSQLLFWDGSWNGIIHALNGGQVYVFGAPSPFNGNNIILEDGALFSSYGGSGAQSINATITLNGIARFEIGDQNRIFTNQISGPGGIVLDAYNHQTVFTAATLYTGPTIIAGGGSGNGPILTLTGNGSILHSSQIFFGGTAQTNISMDVSGRPDQTLTLPSGQTLGGIGTINGSLVVSAGAILSPAGTNTTIGITTGTNATGTITATNAVTLNGTTVIKLNGSGVNDQVQAGAGITYGGTLNLVNISGAPLAVGNSFQIASAASYAGSFASITPATPGAGLAWDTTQLNTLGSIGVVAGPSQPRINSVVVSGGSLILSGTNGTAGGSYSVLTTTNLATPLTNWTALFTNTFDGTGAFSVTNPVSAGTPQRFYNIKLLP
jgi:hypothetical protein